jgi:hypothetical protein
MTSQKTTADNPWVFIEQITTFQKIDTEGVNTIQKFTKKEQETAATGARVVIQYTLQYQSNASNIGSDTPAYPYMADIHDKIFNSPRYLKDFPPRSTGKHTKQKKQKKVSSTTASSNKKRSRDETTDTRGNPSVDT